jgi:hypothetical protein
MSQQPPDHRGPSGRLRHLPRWGRRALGAWLACALGFCLCGAGALAAANPEYQVKAAFLYNFMKFVEWPSDGLSSSTTLTLGILGKDPFGDAIDEVRGKTAKGRRIAVQHLHGVEEARECDMVFVCASEKGRLPQILKALQNQRILTVADQDGFCQAGGMINLVSVKNRVAFEVNLTATGKARLRVSSQLLKLARVVLE